MQERQTIDVFTTNRAFIINDRKNTLIADCLQAEAFPTAGLWAVSWSRCRECVTSLTKSCGFELHSAAGGEQAVECGHSCLLSAALFPSPAVVPVISCLDDGPASPLPSLPPALLPASPASPGHTLQAVLCSPRAHHFLCYSVPGFSASLWLCTCCSFLTCPWGNIHRPWPPFPPL